MIFSRFRLRSFSAFRDLISLQIVFQICQICKATASGHFYENIFTVPERNKSFFRIEVKIHEEKFLNRGFSKR